MTRRARVLLMIGALAVSLGNTPRCYMRHAPTLTCRDFEVEVLPGTEVAISNPCADDGSWGDPVQVSEDFALGDTPHGIWEFAKDDQTGFWRGIVATTDVDPVEDYPVQFTYERGRDFGVGIVRITTFRPFNVVVAASPIVVAAGQPSTLTVTVDGGAGCFTLELMNGAVVIDTVPICRTTPEPVAWTFTVSPTETTQYDIRASNSERGLTTTTSVIVGTTLGLTASATPSSIAAGETSILFVEPLNGVPPYTIEWTPSDSVLQIGPHNWIASPAATTTYTVTVTDATGERLTAGVTVSVTPGTVSGPVADFTFTWDGVETIDLDASASTGDIVRYEWAFTWEPFPIVTTSPTAVFTANPDTTGTITLTVTDRNGATGVRMKAFP